MEVVNLCRSCMVEIATWECDDVDQNTMEMFSFCTNIEISQDDKLPKHFCYNCTVLLESSYAYIRTARLVNGKLKKLVQNGCINFVNNFLNKAADQIVFKEREKIDNKNIIPNYINGEKKTENSEDKVSTNDIDHLFDDDDDICLSKFKSENELKTENEIKTELDDINDNVAVGTPVPDVNGSIAENSKILLKPSCNICKKEFSSDGWLTRHMKTVHTEKSKKKKKLASISKKKHAIQKETKETGDPNNEIKCRVCDKVFSSKQARTKHLNDEHSSTVNGKRVFLCPYCPKTFSKYSHVYYHTTSHPDIAKHPCKSCGKMYRIRKELEQHMRTHLKDRPYACDKCDMRFKLKGILANHLKIHEGIKPYLCSICGNSFANSGNLDSHMRVHTGERPYACTQCTFRTTSNVSLKRHLLRHKGERPYPCTYCPKRFYESCSLTRHLRSHTRERPYRCPYCSREFFDSGKRRRHLVMTHKMARDEIPPMDKAGNPIEKTARGLTRRLPVSPSLE
ncbi:zinc-finger double domain-containing protein [Phthorimaea operculella]|nr:zinc-finger double domain-containing protein [Phthorimaea operculella]